MPIEVSYPGVYAEELPSNSHSIAPVVTNITAFVGRAISGAVEEPTPIFNFQDFRRYFGGLQHDYPMSYAVQDFFENGGGQALIIRLFEPAIGRGAARLSFQCPLTLQAADPGRWGNMLSAKIDTNGINEQTAAQFKDQYGIGKDDLFNLTLTLTDSKGKAVSVERYLNLSVSMEGKRRTFPNRLDKILAAESSLARVSHMPETPPGDGETAQGVDGDDGTYLQPSTYLGSRRAKTGIYALDKCELFNLLCIPPDRRLLPDLPQSEWDLPSSVRSAAAQYAAEARAFYIIDPISEWVDKAKRGELSDIHPSQLGIDGGTPSDGKVGRNCAVYFPRIIKEDPVNGDEALFPACGAISGAIASNDVACGVWNSPAGATAGLSGVVRLELDLSDDDNSHLNSLGINCLRTFPKIGPTIWGARTLRGADANEDEFQYIAIRRLCLFVEEALYCGTQWAVFQPNNEALWSSLRLGVGTFLAGLGKQGALYNYTVQCDATNNTLDSIEQGIVIITVRIAPVDPTEFITLQIQHSVLPV
ncbi:phage tail sheath family protein [Erythrobacter crassostreae]|uniref:Phage tail sheath family protein n=1 Tax=Erythrobacter crassostreae TaxID=2828328 RepID=A0A9X1JQE5_9SPHN|nr:phage tail sheath C-terminal domain-containing protein [Erythrobacter crassostrea]MBV7260317.1 phage tail sheath family protein [Erythrobacter crassostrea]